MKKYFTKLNIVICIIGIICVIFSSIFVFNSDLLKGVDTEYHMSRIIGITNSWKSGDFFAFIHLDSENYGYAIGFFYSNLFMILPSILYLLGTNIILIYKIIIVICGICTAISMFVCVKKITKNKYASTISMVLYTLSSYRIITMVAKGFLGELFSFIFIPLIILGLYEIIWGDEKKWYFLSIGFIGILNSNLVMTEIMIVVSFAFVIFNLPRLLNIANHHIIDCTRFKALLKGIIWSLLISTAFWLPMLEQLVNSTFKMKDLVEWYNPRYWTIEFVNLFWGTIQYKNNLAASYGLGIIFIIILIFRLRIKEKNNIIKFCDICILSGLLLILPMTEIFPWKYLGNIGGTLQFPSRLEVPITAFFSIACGIICMNIKKKNIRYFVMFLIILWEIISSFIVLNSCIDALKKYYHTDNMDELLVKEDFKYDICDGVYLPQNAKHYSTKINEDIVRINTNNKNLKLSYDKNTSTLYFSNNYEDDSYVDIPKYYYYGYVAEGNGINYEIGEGENGQIRVLLKGQSGEIKIYYKTTILQIIALVISIIAILAGGINGCAKIYSKRIKSKKVQI